MKSFKKSRTLIAAAALIGMVNMAEAAGNELSLKALLDLKLQTGSFLELDLKNSPVTMTVINKDQVAMSGSQNLGEVLEVYVPGFQYMINKWNGQLWAMRGVTGDRNDKIIVLINGVKQNLQGFHGFATETNLGLMGDIQRIEVLRGPAGLVYGSGAIAGVVNIVTKEAPQEDGGSVSAKVSSSLFKNNVGRTIQANYAKTLDDGSVQVNFGQHVSDGIGDNLSRIYGIYENTWNPSAGYLGGNSYGKTDGNYLASVDFRKGEFRSYSRFTRQNTNMGSYFLIDPYQEDPAGNRLNINGVTVDKSNPNQWADWHWSNKRMTTRENILSSMTYTFPIGDDKLILSASIDGANNTLSSESGEFLSDKGNITGKLNKDSTISGSYTANSSLMPELVIGVAGEWRRQVGVQYLLKSVENLQLAIGGEYRSDVIGPDMFGRSPTTNIHSWYGKDKNLNQIRRISYDNYALFTEAFYDVSDLFAVEAGARWDKHTKTEGVISPKAALIFKPSEDHVFKLIGQTSSNNADALSYVNADKSSAGWSYEKAYDESLRNGNLTKAEVAKSIGNLQAPAKDLNPERSTSVELTSTHKFGQFGVDLSGSWNQMTDLFLWNGLTKQNENAGEYTALTFEGGLNWQNDQWNIGANIAYQMPLSIDTSAMTVSRNEFEPVWDADQRIWKPVPIKTASGQDSVVTDKIRAQSDIISIDGKYFNNIQTLTSKLFVDYKPADGIILHTDVRYFGGFWNREDSYSRAYQEILAEQAKGKLKDVNASDVWKNDYKLDNLEGMIKWNVSAAFDINDKWSMSLYGMDLLGDPTNKNAARWQQSTRSFQTDLFTVDVRTFAAQLTRKF